MTSHARATATVEFETPLCFDEVVALDGDDDAITAAVHDADLPALLAALAVLTGNEALLAPDLIPPTPPMMARIAPQGGMSAAAQARARALATAVLISMRDQGWPREAPSPAMLRKAITFLTKQPGDDYLRFLMREIGLPEDAGAPKWSKRALAPRRDYRVAVIGAGLAGIAAAYRLSQAGIPYVVIEKNPGLGGVWWNNTYPGCRLDTPNFAYSFSFAQKPDWPQQFSKQEEILKYINEVADRGGLREKIDFSTEVSCMRYDAQKGGWWIDARRDGVDQVYFANAVISAVGHLNRPSIPAIPGQDVFAGRAFHSAEWPDDLDVTDKRVAVIGTGASGFQIVPAIADRVRSLHVFQRNPAWMLPTPNYHDDIKPGMSWLLKRVPYYGRWFRFWQFWLAAEGRFPAVQVDPDWHHPVSISARNEELRQGCLANLAEQVGDRGDLLEKLTPSYPPGAKRMVRDNGAYVGALKKPHVHLVSARIDHLTPTGIVTADGAHHALDAIVYATGFYAADYLDPIAVEGRDGLKLHDVWNGDCRAFLGVSIPAFPNLFILGGPNSGLVVNGSAIFTAECALEYALRAVEHMLRHDIKAVEVKAEVYDAFNAEVDRENLLRAWGTTKVNTWYQGRSGRPTVTWPYPILEYFNRTSRFEPDDFDLEPLDR